MHSLHTVAASKLAPSIRATPAVWVTSEMLYALARYDVALLNKVVGFLGPRLALVSVADANMELDRRSGDPNLRATANRVLASLAAVERRPLVPAEHASMANRVVKVALDDWTEIRNPAVRRETAEQVVAVQFAAPSARLRREIAEQVAAVAFANNPAITIGQEPRLILALNGDARRDPRAFGLHHLLAVLCFDDRMDPDGMWAAIHGIHFAAEPPFHRLPWFNRRGAVPEETVRSLRGFMRGGHLDVDF